MGRGLVPGALPTAPGLGPTRAPCALTSIPREVEAEDVRAVGTEVLQPPQVGLQLPAGQPGLQQQGQVAKDKGIQGGGAGAERRAGERLWQKGCG